MYPEQIAACDRLATIFPDFEVTNRNNSSWVVIMKHKTIDKAGLWIDISLKNKWNISGLWARTASNVEYAPQERKTVGVSCERSNEAIAKDVNKRLLDWYYAEFAVQWEKIQNTNRIADIRKDRLRTILTMLGEDVSEEKLSIDQDRYCYKAKGIEKLRISYNGDGVTLVLKELPFELAMELASVIESIAPANID